MTHETTRDRPNMQAALHKTWRDFNDCIEKLKFSFDDTKIPIDDDNVVFHRFCAKLEFLLSFGMKDRSRVFGNRKNNPWQYFSTCIGKTRNLHEGLRHLQGVREFKTSMGRLRFFLRFCLVHSCLADTIQQCLTHTDVTNDYYNPSSLFGNSQLCSQFITALYEINDVQFDLAPTGYDLDVGWPTFARKQFGHFPWKSQLPSLRSSSSWLISSADTQSISSSSSFAFPQRPRTGSMASNASDTASQSFGQSEPQDEADNATAVDEQLLVKVTQLAEDKGFLEQQVEILTRQLDQEKQESRKYEALLNSEREEHKQTIGELKQRVAGLEEQIARHEGSAQNCGEAKVSDEGQSPREAMLTRQVTSLREAAALCKKMLTIRDGEVELLKKQLVATENKVEAFRERYQLKKTLILEEIRKLTVELETVKNDFTKWMEFCASLAQCEHSDDVHLPTAEKIGAQVLAQRIRQLLTDRSRLEKEIESINETNQSLVKSLAHHESKLTSVTTQLDQTWAWLSRLKIQHGQLQSDEVVLRYELKEKRQLLESLKNQLEESRQKWNKIRQQNSENESTWNTIRQELDTRKSPDESSQSNASPTQSTPEECNAIAEAAFVPPIDLVSDLISDEKPLPPPAIGREERLLLMEEQCRLLYSKLVNTTARNAALVGRLANLHSHYSNPGSTDSDAACRENIEPGNPCQPTRTDTVDEREALVSASVSEQEEEKRMENELTSLLEDKERELVSLKDHVDALKCQCATQELEQERSVQAFNRQHEALQSALERLSHSERMVLSLQRDLQALSGQREEEKESSETQLRQLLSSLSAKDEECEQFVHDLRSALDEVNQLRAAHDKVEAELRLVRADNSELTSQLGLLRDESSQLRNKIVELIREKDSLWQQSDRLLYLQRVHAQDKWTPDGTVQDCQGCRVQFTLFNRRHHCRSCGRIFCHSCSNNWLNIPASDKRVRTCNECYLIHDQFSSCADSSQFLSSSREELDDSTTNAESNVAASASVCAGVCVIRDEDVSQPLHHSSPKLKRPSSPGSEMNGDEADAPQRGWDPLTN